MRLLIDEGYEVDVGLLTQLLGKGKVDLFEGKDVALFIYEIIFE